MNTSTNNAPNVQARELVERIRSSKPTGDYGCNAWVYPADEAANLIAQAIEDAIHGIADPHRLIAIADTIEDRKVEYDSLTQLDMEADRDYLHDTAERIQGTRALLKGEE